MTCQLIIQVNPSTAFASIVSCGKPAPAYRQCGRGGSTCKVEYAFCKEHGGDAKAQELMVTHHQEHHPRDDDGR